MAGKSKLNVGKKRRTLGDVSDEHWRLELAIDELKERIKLLEKEQAALEAEAIHLASTIDDTAAREYRGAIAIGKIKTVEHPKFSDGPKLYAWMTKTKRFEILENRISKTTFFELRESGIVVPGVTVFKHDVFRTSRRKK